ncbi:hypothetical protein BCAR13_1630001 [Paraburkholderia caribensis]|nr:hypothetical protein BCAR13_1630001 [Paraburkholderia caribensis]
MATPSAGRDSGNIPNAGQGDNRYHTEFSDTLSNGLAVAWKSVAAALVQAQRVTTRTAPGLPDRWALRRRVQFTVFPDGFCPGSAYSMQWSETS